jgi:eukaryotic translation initiation factor 2C
MTRNDGDKSGNCPAGFVADEGVGNPAVRDFYLQSHGGLLGSEFILITQLFRPLIVCIASRPSHYITLRDDIYRNSTDE